MFNAPMRRRLFAVVLAALCAHCHLGCPRRHGPRSGFDSGCFLVSRLVGSDGSANTGDGSRPADRRLRDPSSRSPGSVTRSTTPSPPLQLRLRQRHAVPALQRHLRQRPVPQPQKLLHRRILRPLPSGGLPPVARSRFTPTASAHPGTSRTSTCSSTRRACSTRATARAATTPSRCSPAICSQGMPKKRPFEDEGVTCSTCHSIHLHRHHRYRQLRHGHSRRPRR